MGEKELTSEERIANALEEKNEIIMGLLYGVLIAVLLVGGLFVILMLGQPVYDLFVYDLLGNERPPSPVYSTVSSNTIDDCSFSDDEQLCYQMKRIADMLEERQSQGSVLQE